MRSGVFRGNEDAYEFIHQVPVLLFVFNGKQVHLVFIGIIQVSRIDVQGIIHEHIIETAIRTFIAANDQLVFILSEIQAADDAVQLILANQRLPDCAADFIHEVIPEMLYRGFGLFRGFLLVLFQIITFQCAQKAVIDSVIPGIYREITVGVGPDIAGPDRQKLLEGCFPGLGEFAASGNIGILFPVIAHIIPGREIGCQLIVIVCISYQLP